MNLLRSIQAAERRRWVNGFFEQRHPWETDFPLPFVPRYPNVTWLYLVYRGIVVGRLRILRVEQRGQPMEVGTTGIIVGPGSTIKVRAPGEAPRQQIAVRGFQGIRYVEGDDWEDVVGWTHGRA